jgi:hypothetical protein
MHPAMNDTKWDEVRRAMLALGSPAPRWRTRDVATGHESAWDGEWVHHFRAGGYSSIEWLDIEARTPEEAEAIQSALARIHVPGEKNGDVFRVFGYLPSGRFAEFLPAP